MTSFRVEASPHIFSKTQKYKIMWLVVLALMPAIVMSVINFGRNAFLIIFAAGITAAFTEGFFNWVRKKPLGVGQGSAVVTGLLLGMILPPTVPLWIPILGSFFGIAIAKHAFGGAGHAMFNPALIGRAFLVVSFPVIMNKYIWPDGVTSATPLSVLKMEGYQQAIGYFGNNIAAYKSMLFGNIAGVTGETSALALLIGGLFLIFMKVIDWRIPTVYIGTVFALTWLFGHDPIFHILGGGLFLGAFFMATAYEGMPLTKKGRYIFAFGIGLITVLIRLFGGFPEGVTYSILLMNAATPIIERLTMKKPFGFKK